SVERRGERAPQARQTRLERIGERAHERDQRRRVGRDVVDDRRGHRREELAHGDRLAEAGGGDDRRETVLGGGRDAVEHARAIDRTENTAEIGSTVWRDAADHVGLVATPLAQWAPVRRTSTVSAILPAEADRLTPEASVSGRRARGTKRPWRRTDARTTLACARNRTRHKRRRSRPRRSTRTASIAASAAPSSKPGRRATTAASAGTPSATPRPRGASRRCSNATFFVRARRAAGSGAARRRCRLRCGGTTPHGSVPPARAAAASPSPALGSRARTRRLRESRSAF